ncbi:MAG: hypothetical protein OQK79_05270 [Rhodanobacter sp.]|nr:hypothetical protein [Rhodanobacter sp.]
MKGMITLAAAFMLLGTGMASASIEPAGPVRAGMAAELNDATLQLKQAFTDLNDGNYKKAVPELDTLIAAPGFSQLSTELRFQTLKIAAAIALQHKNYAKAHRLAVRATGFAEADAGTWLGRLFSAFFINDNRDGALCVTTLAKQWPDRLDEVLPRGISTLHHALHVANEDDVDQAMLTALFDIHWQAELSTSDTLWRDLALMLIEHHEHARAAAVAKRIRAADTALSMRIDKRFDPITRIHPQAFDVGRLLTAQIQAARARIKAHPDQLKPVQRLQELLIDKGQTAEVLAVSDAAVAHAERGDGEQTYTDFDSSYSWVLNLRSDALAQEGRWDDAVREMTRAARRPEGGGMNVSQSINLAGLYADLNEPDKAAAAIVEPGGMTPYGSMQLHCVRLQIALEKNDTQAITAHMAYLRTHQIDDIATWQRALLRHGDLDAAAALLIQRLKNPDWRSSALVSLQHYADGQQTPTMKAAEERWNTVRSRPDVQAAVANVGRIGHFDMTAPAY